MTTEYETIENHLKDMIEGSVVTRSIDSDIFKVVDVDIDEYELYAMSMSKPFPVSIIPGPEFDPLESPANVSGSTIYYGQTFVVEVGLAATPQNMRTFFSSVKAYERMLRRTIGYPTNWNSVSCFSKVIVQPVQQLQPVVLRGDDGEELEEFYVMQLLVDITYWEDHSS